jgi:hypothetical protein
MPLFILFYFILFLLFGVAGYPTKQCDDDTAMAFLSALLDAVY